jgi:hypothetical protein
LKSGRPNVGRVLLGAIMAGALINTSEYLVHGLLLDPQWKAAFAALGKTPTGWATFIPSNFLIGNIGIWIYAKFRPNVSVLSVPVDIGRVSHEVSTCFCCGHLMSVSYAA